MKINFLMMLKIVVCKSKDRENELIISYYVPLRPQSILRVYIFRAGTSTMIIIFSCW